MCTLQGSLDASGGLDACIALQAHLTGVPLEPIERELAVYSPSWSPLSSSTSSYGDHDVSSGGDGADSVGYGSDGYSSNTHAAAGAGPGGGGSGSERPPTPLHGATWRRPPSSSARLENRLLDASIQMCAATFATQDDHYQAAAIESMAELLIDRSFANASAFSSVNTCICFGIVLLEPVRNGVVCTLGMACLLSKYGAGLTSMCVSSIRLSAPSFVILLRLLCLHRRCSSAMTTRNAARNGSGSCTPMLLPLCWRF